MIMINKVVIFLGPKKYFKKFLDENIGENTRSNFHELIKYMDEKDSNKYDLDNLIVNADDYSSVNYHVLLNFAAIVTSKFNIKNLYLHNPPKRVEDSFKFYYKDNIDYKIHEYQSISRENLIKIYSNLNSDIQGQSNCKKQIISALYRLSINKKNKPIVLILYGPSGVGKTQTVKNISETLGGELLRIQFSMMHTSENYEYIFGSEHSKRSFARDLMSRETNIILFDEFDKVNSSLYNAFYELFDEGKYTDTNYEVDLRQAIFICTSNFKNEQEIEKTLGSAMFSRISCCIKFDELSKIDKEIVLNKHYNDIISSLNDEEKHIIGDTNILEWFGNNIGRFNNIRILKKNIENAIFDKLTDEFIINTYTKN